MFIDTEGTVHYTGKYGDNTIDASSEQDVLTALAALGDKKAQEMITGLPSSERTITVNGSQYKIIVDNGVTTVEIAEGSDGTT
jgi:hypothetical protein